MEIAALISTAVIAGLVGGALGFLLGRYVWPAAPGVSSDAIIRAQSEAARLADECAALQNRLDQMEGELTANAAEAKTAGEEVARLTERIAGLSQALDEKVTQNSTLQTESANAANEAKNFAAEVATLKEREAAHERQIAEQANENTTLQNQYETATSEARRLAAEVATLREREAANERRIAEQTDQNVTLQTQYDSATTEAKALSAELATLREREAAYERRIAEQTDQNTTLQTQHNTAAGEAKALAAEVAKLNERETGLLQKIEAQATQLADLQKQLTAEFENIATRILKSNSSELSETSQKSLAAILDPLRERIQEFQRKVETTYEAETREVLSLKEQIKTILETSNSIGSQADGLAKALRGDSQLLGRWGELALERILEAAGLSEGRGYISQGRGLGLKNDAGGVQKPDIIVTLPDQRTMIVDSKVPLTSYERLIAAKDEASRLQCATQFVIDVKGHIDGLAGKRYQENPNLKAHDCVLMFVPIEGALAAALTTEPDLFLYAWNQSVVLVGPPTLLMTMRTVASIWRYQLQGENAQEIARLAGDLCDKVGSSLTDLNSVAEKITGALNAHNEAVKRLSTGKGNVLSIGNRMRNLGVKTKRVLPSVLIDGISVSADTIVNSDDDPSPLDTKTNELPSPANVQLAPEDAIG